MAIPLPRNLKRALKGRLKHLRLRYARWRRAFDTEELLTCFGRLGLREGDVVLVHSSFDRFEGFTGKPTDVIGALQRAVGPRGAVLMPTIPFTGTAVAYVREQPVFDVRRTPSRMGILSELFRRMPGVLRSVHPTHSVAAWGESARELIADHHCAETPCGRGTPYHRLIEVGGRVLFLGTGIEPMTLFHAAEEIMEPHMPFSPFTTEVFRLLSRTATGETVETKTRLFDPAVSRRRDITLLQPVLKRRGAWREARIGGVDIILLDATDVMDALQTLSKEGHYCYE
jgi:aminoglycoside 3-N-acetyltransferase